VVLFLLLVTTAKINISLIIGVLLIFVALKNFSRVVDRAFQFIVKYERLYLMAMGLVHGMSNLGGSLLTMIIYSKHYNRALVETTQWTRITYFLKQSSINVADEATYR